MQARAFASVLRFLSSAALAFLILAAPRAHALLSAQVEIPARIHAPPQLLGTRGTIELRVHNPSAWRSQRVRIVRASCGCVGFDGEPVRVEPGADATLPLTVVPREMVGEAYARVWLEHRNDRMSATDVHVPVAAPLDGWPGPLRASLREGDAIVAMNPRYQDLIGDLSAFMTTGSGEELSLPVYLEPGRVRIILPDSFEAHRQTVEMVAVIGLDEPVRLARNVRFDPAGEGDDSPSHAWETKE